MDTPREEEKNRDTVKGGRVSAKILSSDSWFCKFISLLLGERGLAALFSEGI